MVVQPSPHGDYHYRVVTRGRTGAERAHEFASEDPLEPGDVLRLDGRYWLIADIETGEDAVPRALAVPARYRLRLRHPDGREELGGLRRFRPDAPRLGHSFTTLEDGQPVGWEVVDEQLEQDEHGEPYLGFTAERDFAEVEALPSHELEHTLARDRESELPQTARAAFDRAEQLGQSVELVALEPGEEPDWDGAERFIEAIVIEEVEELLPWQLRTAAAGRPRRVMKTFMFTDIVGSTQLVEALGDEAWEVLLRWHDDTLRAVVAANQGEEVVATGDGFFVGFDSPEAAVACAIAIQRRFADHRRQAGFAPAVRIGIHASGATQVGRNFTGKGVHEAARIAALADGGQILASLETVSGTRFTYKDQHEVTLRGTTDAIEIATVDWS